MQKFKLYKPYEPTSQQTEVVDSLVKNFKIGKKYQVLLGVTGSGKTFVMASLIEKLQRPALIISHNKTLAAQLYQELRSFSRRTQSHFLFLIMTITNQKLIFRQPIPILRRILPSMRL